MTLTPLISIFYLTNKLHKFIVKKFPKLDQETPFVFISESALIGGFAIISVLVTLMLFYQLGGYESINRKSADYSTTIKVKGKDGTLYQDVGLIVCGQFCAVHVKDATNKKQKPTILMIPVSDIEYIKQRLSSN